MIHHLELKYQKLQEGEVYQLKDWIFWRGCWVTYEGESDNCLYRYILAYTMFSNFSEFLLAMVHIDCWLWETRSSYNLGASKNSMFVLLLLLFFKLCTNINIRCKMHSYRDHNLWNDWIVFSFPPELRRRKSWKVSFLYKMIVKLSITGANKMDVLFLVMGQCMKRGNISLSLSAFLLNSFYVWSTCQKHKCICITNPSKSTHLYQWIFCKCIYLSNTEVCHWCIMTKAGSKLLQNKEPGSLMKRARPQWASTFKMNSYGLKLNSWIISILGIS